MIDDFVFREAPKDPVQAAFERNAWRKELAHSIFAIIRSNGENRSFTDSGAGFVIAVQNGGAYALTAAHIFDQGLESLPEVKKQSQLRHLPPDPGALHAQSDLYYVALFLINGGMQRFQIVEYHSLAPDIAVIKLVPDPEAESSDLRVLRQLILSTDPNVDTRLTLASVEYRKGSFLSTRINDVDSIGFASRLAIRDGTLIDRISARHVDSIAAIRKGFVFKSTLTIDPGMSGGPVFNRIQNNVTNEVRYIVCGIASADLPSNNSDTDSGLGRSVCSSVWNALMLPIAAATGETVLDWLQQSKIWFFGLDPPAIVIQEDEHRSGVFYLCTKLEDGRVVPVPIGRSVG